MNPDYTKTMLFSQAQNAFRQKYHVVKHTIAAAICVKKNNFNTEYYYSAINLRGANYSTCAERICCGYIMSQLSLGSYIDSILTLYRTVDDKYKIILPCGNCRQFLIDYLPDIKIFGEDKVFTINELMPYAYKSNFKPIESEIAKYKETDNH